jgi:addiction module HigA family antidote
MALTAIHPGEHLAEELEALDMSAAELARKINVPTNRITRILNGTLAITGDTALRLAHFFGTSAQFWLNLQSLYDLRLAQEKVGKSIKGYRERETSEIRRRSGGSGPPLRTALQNSKLPGMFPEFVAGRLDESQPAIPSPRLAVRLDPYSPASAD